MAAIAWSQGGRNSGFSTHEFKNVIIVHILVPIERIIATDSAAIVLPA
jgi:hypothetical protein